MAVGTFVGEAIGGIASKIFQIKLQMIIGINRGGGKFSSPAERDAGAHPDQGLGYLDSREMWGSGDLPALTATH